MPDVWGLATIAAKFALYVGILTAAGAVFAAQIFKLDQYRTSALFFASLGLFASLFVFSLRGAIMTGDAGGMIDPEMLGLLWSTPVGTALIYRIAGLCLLIAGVFMGRIGLWVSVMGGLIAVLSFNHGGHIADRDAVLLDALLILHLIAAAFWIGILMPLKRLALKTETYVRAAEIGHQFGMIASFTVPLLILAGVYMGYVLLGSVSALIGTDYGIVLLLKVILVAGLLMLAALNKLRFVPALKAGDSLGATHLVRSISVEWMVILAILAVTATLTSTLTVPA